MSAALCNANLSFENIEPVRPKVTSRRRDDTRPPARQERSRVHIHCEDGSEYLLHRLEFWIGGNGDGGLDKVTLGVIGRAACQHFNLAAAMQVGKEALVLVKGLLVDDGAHESREIVRLPHLKTLSHALHELLQTSLNPHALGHIQPGGGTALLALVLESTSHCAIGHMLHICGRVDDVKVLAPCLSHYARVRAVRVQVSADLLP